MGAGRDVNQRDAAAQGSDGVVFGVDAQRNAQWGRGRMKTLRIAWRLLWANRWVWLLLVLWPWAMAAMLLAGGLHPSPEDVDAAFQQESIYGLALVAFAGG